MPKDKELDPCQKYACRIQTCLAKSNYQESKCQFEISKLVECCNTWKDKSFKVCQGIAYEGNTRVSNTSRENKTD